MTLLYFGCFSSFFSRIFCVFTMNATIPIQRRFARIVSVCIFLFFLLLLLVLRFVEYLSLSLFSFYSFWFLHHLLFFFQFLCVRLFWCFFSLSVSISFLSSESAAKGKKKRPNCKSNLSFLLRHTHSTTLFMNQNLCERIGVCAHASKSRINIDFCFFFAVCVFLLFYIYFFLLLIRLPFSFFIVFSSVCVFCVYFFFRLFVCRVLWRTYDRPIQVFSFSLCNPFGAVIVQTPVCVVYARAKNQKKDSEKERWSERRKWK